MNSDKDEATSALLSHSGGESRDAAELLPLVYDQLRRLAAHYMRRERAGHTLQPTALVNEAYMKLIEIERVDWRSKAHFLAMASRQMRRVLIDHARTRGAKKRADHELRVTFDEQASPDGSTDLFEVLALNEVLERLTEVNERQARIAEMRLFGGMQVKEIAAALDLSERTIKSDWRFARLWLMRELSQDRG